MTRVFPRFWKFACFYWVLIGSLRCFISLWLVVWIGFGFETLNPKALHRQQRAFLVNAVRQKLKQSQWPLKKQTNKPTKQNNQGKEWWHGANKDLRVKTSKHPKAWENATDKVTIDFSFASNQLITGAKACFALQHSQRVTKNTQCKPRYRKGVKQKHPTLHGEKEMAQNKNNFTGNTFRYILQPFLKFPLHPKDLEHDSRTF